MKTLSRLLAASPLLALPLLAFVPRGDEVGFHPADGTSLSKKLELSATFYVDDISASMAGQELPPEAMGQIMDQGLLFEAVVGVTDEYVSTKGGKVQQLLRTFDDLSLEAGPESEAENVDEFAKLEDSTIEFRWDEESGEYKKSYHESEGDDALLENLDVNMDLTALLPKGEVGEGDSWEVKGKNLATVFLPGGLPASPGDDAGDEAEEMSELFKEEIGAQLEEAFTEFAVVCTYKGTREDGDKKLGVIELEFKGEGALDLSDLIQSAIDLQGGDMGVEADVTASVDLTLEGKGTLLWDLAAGYVNHYEMEGDLVVNVDVEAQIDAQGQSFEGALSAEVSGDLKWVLSTEQ